jgi:2Fe-2S ferredoxin
MAKVHFTLADGEAMEIETNDGETLMRAATRCGVPGIVAECGGEMNCATCHVYIHSPWREKVRRPSSDEVDLVSEDDGYTEDSRLSCQIKVIADLDGLQATVVHEG